jgi:hypothetical protein
MNHEMNDSAMRPLTEEELDLATGGLGEKIMPAVVATIVQLMLKNGDMAPVKCNSD